MQQNYSWILKDGDRSYIYLTFIVQTDAEFIT